MKDNNIKMQAVVHNIPPVYDENSKILILGSFPSVKSRENNFFYGHPQNRFWRVLANLYNEPIPVSIEDKKYFLLKNNIALWDTVASCTICGSSDSSIKNVVANDISVILKVADIKMIFTNGNTADKLYKKYIYKKINIEPIKLPSTSPANARFTFNELLSEWKKIII